MVLYVVIIAATAIAASMLYIPKVIVLLNESQCIRKNYKGISIPSIGGIVFIPVLLTTAAVSAVINISLTQSFAIYLFIIGTMGFIGLLDDLIGVKEVKGIKNHISSFLKGRLTTGFIKAFIGGLLALIISLMQSESTIDALINFFIVVLATNALNILDLRPGRSSKAFIAGGTLLLVLKPYEAFNAVPLLAMLFSAAVYLYFDIRELCMLGDVGSNIYGITLGYYIVNLAGLSFRLVLFFSLLFLNILAEKKSLTEIISKNKLLSFLDNLGRGY